MKKSILILAILLITTFTFAQHRNRKSGGGRYIGGHGSSHWGGHYSTTRKGTGDHYSRRKH
jgi:predicted small secreted protein